MTIRIKDHEVCYLTIVDEIEKITLTKFIETTNDNSISKDIIKKSIIEPFNNFILDRSIYYGFDKKKPCGQITNIKLSSKKLFLSAEINKYYMFEKDIIPEDNIILDNISIGPSYKYNLSYGAVNKDNINETLISIEDIKFVGFGLMFSEEITKKIKIKFL